MKTRNISLPLVILAALAFGNTAYAQQVAHYQLLAYLEKMPSTPVFPDNTTLASAQPTSFEDNDDLKAIEKKLQSLAKNISTNGVQIGAIGQTIQESSPVIEEDIPNVKETVHSLQVAIEEMQAVKIEFGHDVGKNMIYMVKTKSNMASDGRAKRTKNSKPDKSGSPLTTAALWVDAIKIARQLLKATGSVANATALLKALADK